ncbi:MAG: oligosaccharide flippase family protein, partial [Gemmatimonadetes bacterium]|nr:oligosaccharide flippase family protein [Gemmatimonadota bacterium]
MVINKRKVRGDILLYTSSQFLYKLVGYGVLMMLTRHLSQDRMGEFFLAASLAGVTAMLAELGTNSYMTRALASRAEERVTIFSEVISFQVPVLLILFALLNGAVWLAKPHLLDILALTSVYIILEQAYLAFGALFVGMHRVSYNVICGVAAKLLLIGLVAVAVNRELTLNGILLCYIAANCVLLGIAVYLSRRVIRGIRFSWDLKETRRFVGIALSFFGIGLLGTIHFSADTLMLGSLSTFAAVATYETAFKLLEAARFVIRAVYTIYF